MFNVETPRLHKIRHCLDVGHAISRRRVFAQVHKLLMIIWEVPVPYNMYEYCVVNAVFIVFPS